MNPPPKFSRGDLVTYTKDLLGVQDYSGIVTEVFCDEDNIWYAMIQWIDGAEYPEMFRHIRILVKAKDEHTE